MRHHIQTFVAGEHDNIRLTLTHQATLTASASVGSWTSPVYVVEPFNQVILSWNALTPGASWIEVELRVRLGQGWTVWYSLGQWGAGILSRSVADQKDDQIAIEVDTLICRQGCGDAWQTRVMLYRDPETGDTPTVIDLLIWAGQRTDRQPLTTASHPAWGQVMDVPQRSQAVEAADVRWHICSPTSLGMVLAYYGVNQTTSQVCDGVFDHGAGIWGNWPLNAAYVLPASEGRLIGHVERWDGFEPLEDEIAAGRPVVLSHRWQDGELEGAHSSRSSGHLIVVVGFNEHGHVVVNDPAFETDKGESVRQVYRRQDIYRTWLERGSGVVYTVKPR